VASDLRVADITGDHEKWSEYLSEFPDSGAAHHWEWGNIIRQAYGMEGLYLAALRGFELQGLLPLVSVKSRIFPNAIVSMPYLNDGGILAKDHETELFLWSYAKSLLEESRMPYLELRHSRDINLGISPRTDKVSTVIDIAGGAEDVWSRKLHTNVRNKVRKSEKMGVEVREGPQWLSAFYEMHVMNMKELGSPAHSFRFFKEAVNSLKDNIKIYAAFVDGRVVGGKIVCYFKDTVYFLWVSSPRRYLNYAAVSLMDWVALRDGAAKGLMRCDFGRSTKHSTHFDFKKKWGAEIRPLFWHTYPVSAKGSYTNFSNKYEVFRKAWGKLPLFVVKLLGPWLRKGLPQ
jgi:FemAB-related protein (PEP-CTERM system-associated)